MRRPAWSRSIRFRLTALYSSILFALAGAGLAVTYVVVERVTDPRPVTAQTYEVIKQKADGREYSLGEVELAEIEEIESEVNLRLLETLRTYSLIALGVFFLASLGIGWILAGRALRPVGAITRTAREIQATDLSRRIRLDGPHDELRDLADTIDSMLDRLDSAFRAQRQLIDDASHELRSPLAIIRTNLDASLTAPEATDAERDRAVVIIDRATTRMSRLVEDLLATARRDADALADAELDLADVVLESADEHAVVAEQAGVRLDVGTTNGLILIGDIDALRRAAGNLVSNAIRHSPQGATVRLAAGRSGDWFWLAVADAGRGIAVEDQARVFDRFWRAPAAPGDAPAVRESREERRTGLGLAIVRQIVESHGGRPQVFSVPGEGSTFVLWLPADRSEGGPPPATNPLA